MAGSSAAGRAQGIGAPVRNREGGWAGLARRGRGGPAAVWPEGVAAGVRERSNMEEGRCEASRRGGRAAKRSESG